MRFVRIYDLSTLAAYSLDKAHKIGQGYITRELTAAEKQKLLDRALSEFSLINNVIGANAFFGFKTVEYAEDVPDLPDDKIFAKHRVVNGDFKKRKSAGEIVMAPYRVDNVKITFQYGTEKYNQRDPKSRIVSPKSFNDNPWDTIKFDDEWESANLGALSFSMVSYLWNEDLFSPQDLGWDISAKDVLSKFLALRTTDSTLVTHALAGANEGKMDLLTTLAEVPETVGSVFEGLKLVAKLSKDARNKEFSLTQRSEKGRAKLDAELARRLSEINRKRLGANTKQKRILDKMARKYKRHYKREVEDLLRELNDGLASVWMNFRYNIMPNVYAMEDALEFIGSFYNEYDSSRAKDVFEPDWGEPPTGFEAVTSSKWVVTHKCLVKSRYAIDQGLSSRILSHGSANIAKTIWELGTRSFVVDWFLNVGDYLTALLGFDMSEERLTSYSWKNQQTLAFNHKTSGAKVYVETNLYERAIINPYDCISLTVSNNLNLFRAIDSVAMLWPSIKRLLSSSK